MAENKKINPESFEKRSATTDIAIGLGPTAAVVANHLLSLPRKDPPPKVELPPGAKKD